MDQNLLKIRPTLMTLKPGETFAFPLIRMKSVRTQASELGMLYKRKYTTKIDRELEVILVKRVY